MKKSRIICSIITITYMLLLVYIGICLLRNSIEIRSGLSFGIKCIYILILIVSVTVYMQIKKKLIKRVINQKIINLYKYMYLAVLTLVSRISMVYILAKTDAKAVQSAYANGIGSYIFNFINKAVDYTAFTNAIVNTVITYVVAILIKKILENITKSDFLSATAAMLYIFLPQGLYFVIQYNRYNYNLLFILIGFYIILKIIDLVKQYKLKTNKYLFMSILLGIVASVDLVLGGSWLFWVLLVILLTVSATHIDIAHLTFGEKIKQKVSFNLKRILYKIEQINFSKLINTALIVFFTTGITKIIINICTTYENFDFTLNINELLKRTIEALNTSRNYYIILIVAIEMLEIIGVVLKRNIDIKMIAVKTLNILVIGIMLLSKNATYNATIFDTTLILLLVSNMCNIYYNREEKIKLLKERN